MSDRTSAGLFARIFETLHTVAKQRRREDLSFSAARDLALDFWALTEDYDFSPYQMGCDEALIAFGLAQRFKPGTDEERTVYLGDDDFEVSR